MTFIQEAMILKRISEKTTYVQELEAFVQDESGEEKNADLGPPTKVET